MPTELIGATELIGDEYGDEYGAMFTGDADLDHLLAMGAGISRHPHHAAHRRAAHAAPGRQFQTRDTTRGVWRKGFLPVNLAGGFTATIAALAAGVVVSVVAQRMFRPDRLIIGSNVAGGFVVNDIRVGVEPQLYAVGAVPGQMFAENAVNIELHGDTAMPGQSLSVVVSNITNGALPFVASFQGFTAL